MQMAVASLGAIVAILVQQFDNELLAPWIYGKALDLHPAVILLSIAAGTALFGIAGTLLAVPVAGMAINGVTAFRDGKPIGFRDRRRRRVSPDAPASG